MQIVETGASIPLPQQLPMRLLAAIAVDYSFVADFHVVAAPPPGERSAVRVQRSATHDIWLIRWGPDSTTVLHDHGGSAGVLYVAQGGLVEHRPNPAGIGRPIRRDLREREYRPMSASHVHEVANESMGAAATIHVYSPPLVVMHHYEPTVASELRMMRREVVEVDTFATE